MFQKLRAVVNIVFLFPTFLLSQAVDSLRVTVDTTTILEASVLSIEKKIDTILQNEVVFSSNNKIQLPLQDLATARQYDSLWLSTLHSNAASFSEMRLEIQAPSNTDDKTLTTLPVDTLKARLAVLDAKTPFHITYNPSLEKVIRSFLTHRRELIERMITISQFYFPLFEQELDRHDIPLEIKYLAVVESALNPRARSKVGAKGLWQFMYSTGKMYDLEVSNYMDERHDPILATQAACRYLARLYDIFDDWDLALAAYNSGPGNVSKAIRRSGGYKNYWNIRAFLPSETAGYVPAFLATLYLFEYAEAHGLQYKKAERPYFETDTVLVKQQITFDQIATLLDISTEELEMLNPVYKLNIIPNIAGKHYALRLPVSKIGAFVNNEDALYAYAQKEFEALEKPLPQFVAVTNRIRYKVKSGDYLGKIAERYKVNISQIKRWNGLKNSRLRIGQRLTIFPSKPYIPQSVAQATTTPSSSTRITAKVHTVQKGDSLWTISRQYPGISVENLRKWNGLRSNTLQPGAKLKLCSCPS